MFQPIHDHFAESLWRIRNNRTGKGKGGEEQRRPAEGKGKEKGKTKDSEGKVGREPFDFNFDYRRPFYIKYVKVDNWETHKNIQYEEDYVKTVEEKLWEEAGMETEEWRQDTVCMWEAFQGNIWEGIFATQIWEGSSWANIWEASTTQQQI